MTMWMMFIASLAAAAGLGYILAYLLDQMSDN
jgi:hypothetical protein